MLFGEPSFVCGKDIKAYEMAVKNLQLQTHRYVRQELGN
jgi:hypothetical protein